MNVDCHGNHSNWASAVLIGVEVDVFFSYLKPSKYYINMIEWKTCKHTNTASKTQQSKN